MSVTPDPPQQPKFVFVRPSEAPTFTPTEEEFRDPLAYINKIRPFAEHAGICKIRPPPRWQPPFAVDVDNFKFTPRVQRLNELEAKTRVKLNFLDRIAKFWELQGTSLKIPLIDKKPLDLYNLHQLVRSDGGRDKINTEKKWNSIAIRLGYEKSRNLGAVLKAHYEKFLYPFDLFEASKDKLIQDTGSTSSKGSPVKTASPKKVFPMKVNPGGGGRMGGKVKTPVLVDDRPLSSACPNELKRLAFYGAGPKMAGFNSKSSQNLQLRMTQEELERSLLHSNVSEQGTFDPLSKYVCRICTRGDAEHQMLLCDGCDDSYHTFCLEPPLTDIPKGEWRCPKCVADEVSKPSEAFGFEQAAQEYTLQQFGEMADQFKSEYFNMPVHLVPSEKIENEFWRIVSAIDEDVTVEYGADLHTMDHGSGFPTAGPPDKWAPEDERYVKSGWNLNNLPVLTGSVLGHINTDISGMMVPWMYVGMCFATFCWHNEDHWSYSINYLHWGEAKTWYGVPGSRADDFEDAMKSAAPELFHSQPDLLHQLVTIMNPNILTKAGVPVYRMDQKAGEFIVTFPRAYHAGFNQGYNFAEAVNFAPADWLAFGRSCVEHYSLLHRYCVFAHDELICKMAAKADELELMIAVATCKDFVKMYEAEKEYRRQVLTWGVTQCERVAFELLPDDAKLCDFCKTTCFLSAITCSCSKDRLVCLKHYDQLCNCPPAQHILKFRYTMTEIPDMMVRLKERTDEYENWSTALQSGMNGEEQNKIDLEELEALLEEGERKEFPVTPTFEEALKVKEQAQKCANVARRLTSPAVRTRNRNVPVEDGKFNITLKELELFDEEISTLPVRIREWAQIRILLQRLQVFKAKADQLMMEESPSISELKATLEDSYGIHPGITLPERARLLEVQERQEWLKRVEKLIEYDPENPHVWTIDSIETAIDSSSTITKHPKVERCLVQLRQLKTAHDDWEEKANEMLMNRATLTLDGLCELLEESKNIRVHLSAVGTVRDLVRKTTDWMNKAREFRMQHEDMYLDELESFVDIGHLGPLVAKELGNLKVHLSEARLFRRRAAELFLRSYSQVQLVEVFLPRREISRYPTRGVTNYGKRNVKGAPPLLNREQFAALAGVRMQDMEDTGKLIKALEVREAEEIQKMTELRSWNQAKRIHGNEDVERYCVCQSKWDSGIMIQCQLCLEHYHATCVLVDKNEIRKPNGVSTLAMTIYQMLARNIRFFCPRCRLSRRPSLECLVEFLTLLQNMVVRVPEGEGIEFLTQRAMRWVDRARDFLARDDISEALKLAHPVGVIRREDLPPCRAKTYLDRTKAMDFVPVWRSKSRASITIEDVDKSKIVMGAPGLRLWMEQMQEYIGKSSLDPLVPLEDPALEDEKEATENKSSETIKVEEGTGDVLEERQPPEERDLACRLPVEMIDHVYCSDWTSLYDGRAFAPDAELGDEVIFPSTSRTFSSQYKAGSPKKPFLLNRDAGEEGVMRGPSIFLSSKVLKELDDLIMEGDLMEVSITETEQLYRIREYTKPPVKVMHISIIQEAMEAELSFKGLVKAQVKKEPVPPEELSSTKSLRSRRSSAGQAPPPPKPPIQTKVATKRRASAVMEEQDTKGKKKRQVKPKKYITIGDEFEKCGAANCKIPMGKQSWVQCEFGCELWFHFTCLGLKKGDIQKIQKYCCAQCLNKSQKSESTETPPGSPVETKEEPPVAPPAVEQEQNPPGEPELVEVKVEAEEC